MIIILEGPDGSGKTTLARHLQGTFGLEYHHEGPPPEAIPALEHYGALLEGARQKEASDALWPGIIFDRFALGERVYGPIYRGQDKLGADGWRVMRRLIVATGAIEILCLPPYEIALANWETKLVQKNEMITDPTTYKKTYDAFAEVMSFDYRYDYIIHNEEQLFAYVKLLAASRRKLPPKIVGWPTAHYLLVGDRGSDPDSRTTDLAFFGTSDSSRYLTEALDLADFKEYELAFMNAFHHSPQPNVAQIPRQSWKVIALGRHAARVCSAQGVHHAEVPHPQFWRRFNHKKIAAYAEILRNAR